jgi:hypothetical protein
MCNGRPNHDDPRMSLHGTQRTISAPAINRSFEGGERTFDVCFSASDNILLLRSGFARLITHKYTVVSCIIHDPSHRSMKHGRAQY